LLYPAPAGKVGAQHAAPPTSLPRHLRCCYGICGAVTASAVLLRHLRCCYGICGVVTASAVLLRRLRRCYGVCAGGVRGGRIAWPSVLLSVPNQMALVAAS